MWRVDESRVWKTSREIGAYHRFVVTEQHRAHAAFARCNEHRPENRRRDGSMNRDSAAPADASSARLGATSRSSIALHAARAIVSVRSWTDAPCGRHRLHGRNPARSASLGVAWNAMFLRSAGRAAQLGRQYTPVVATEKKNAPSAATSRAAIVGRSDAELASRGVSRRIVDARPRSPCHISLVVADLVEGSRADATIERLFACASAREIRIP